MISFKTFVLVEAGDNPYPYHKDNDVHPNETRYNFDAGDTPYRVAIHHSKNGEDADVSFGITHHHPQLGGFLDFHQTHDQGLKAAKIMSTVHHIVSRHVNRHPSLKTVGFTSDTDEPSRVALYTRYTKRLGGTTYDSKIIQDTKLHVIPADSYRK